MNQLQQKILEIMKFVDDICRRNKIEYCIMGGTALGAVRHGGFIPWDDDIDIFMTYNEYKKFRNIMNQTSDRFVLQEWCLVPEYLQYAKVRMNGTAFIEKHLIGRKDLHQGIFIDIMILHKIPKERKFLLKKQYFISKYLTLKGNINYDWKPKKASQYPAYYISKLIPRFIDKYLYKQVYKYDDLKDNFDYIYYITKANISQGYFKYEVISPVGSCDFEGIKLCSPNKIKDYLAIRYNNFMKLPPKEEQLSVQHAEIWSTDKDYGEILSELSKERK